MNLQSFRNQILSLARLPFRHARNRQQIAPGAAESQAFVAPGAGAEQKSRGPAQPTIAQAGRFVYVPVMSFWFRLAGAACVIRLAVVLGGCTPSGQSLLSEEKEPHFVLGKSRVNAMDFTGAIEAFEQSLEANPHSAAAHFELGWLDDEKAADPAAAIYHYQEYLKLNPNADNADVIKQRIYRCKQQLAADVLPLPSAPAAQQQLEKLSEQNRNCRMKSPSGGLITTASRWRPGRTPFRCRPTTGRNSPPPRRPFSRPRPWPGRRPLRSRAGR